MFSNLKVHAHFKFVSSGREGMVISIVLLAPGFQTTSPPKPTREIFELVLVFTAPMTTVDLDAWVSIPYTAPVSGR